MDTKNKVAFITGGASGIGLATAKKLIEEGARVVIFSKNTAGLKIEASPENFLIIEGDVTNQGDVQRGIAETIKKFNSLDILVNNAGVAQRKNFEETTGEDWDFVFSVNVKGVFNVTREALRVMGEGKEKIIINIASGTGIHGVAGLSLYSASKAAIINFSQSLSQELESKGIKVITVAPGSTDTNMFKMLFSGREARHAPENVADVIYKAVIGEIEPDEHLIVDVFYHAR